jgi:cell fate regulator YaaT (PSP1 superfamily)
MERSYLVRYGIMGEVSRFPAPPGADLERGQAVVVRTHRGTELGEVLSGVRSRPAEEFAVSRPAGIVRVASEDDRERARLAEAERPARFAMCRRVLGDGLWPFEVIDLEILPDGDRTILYYLGPHDLDVSGLLPALHASCGFALMLQPVGVDLAATGTPDNPEPSCGSCGSGQGCGSAGGGCGSGGHGCSGCAVKALVTRGVG